MIKALFNKLLSSSGKSYKIDPAVPNSMLLYVLYNRVIMLFRGYVFTGKKVFLGKNCTLLNKSNIHFGKNVTIEKHTTVDGFASQKIILGDGVKIGSFSLITCTSHLSSFGKGLQMGTNSAIGDFAHFGASGGIEIGNDVIMGSYISFHSQNHNFNDSSKLIREQGVTSKGIKIGNNIWVGAKATFLDGCVVGNNCVVASGAVVNDVFPDNVVIGGVPAKILKQIDS
jgi:acetyltransferase-like isoleucine patch superfamily enzyme